MDNITAINLGACPLQYLSIGYVGETGARPVAFDFSAWAEEYGAGVLQLLLQRPGDAEPYPVLLDIDGTTAVWTPDDTDTEKAGQGQAQLVYTVGGVIVKNAIFRVLIAPSLAAAGDPPEPYEDWLQRLLTIAAEAQQSAIDAAGSAEAAGTSAGAAAGSAGAAAQSALDAEAAKSGAESAEQTAQQAAALAGEKAAEAAEAGQIAGENADYAQQQRIMAEADAVDAHDSAESAAQSAEDAQAAITAARLAADSAETFADNAEAAADGANQAKTDAQSAASAAAASATSAAASAAVAQELIDQIPDIEAEIDTKAPAIYATAGPAAIATFDDGAEDMPLKSLIVDIPATQSGTGDPSPENVRPFVGRESATVMSAGTNLLPLTLPGDAFAGVFGTGDTSIATATNARCWCIYVGKNQSLRYQNASTGAAVALAFADEHLTRRAGAVIYDALNVTNRDTAINSGAHPYLVVNISNTALLTPGGVLDSRRCMLSFGAGRKAYAPRTDPTTLEILFPAEAGTVYAGTLTVNQNGSGTLSVLPHYASYNGETLVGPWLSSMDVYAEGAVPTTGAEVVDLGGAATVYQLTAEQIKALGGVNNLWSNAGDVTVTYPADTKSYVDAVKDNVDTLSGEVDTLQDDVDALEGDVAALSALPIISPPDVETLLDGGEYTDEAKKALRKALGIPNFDSELIYDGTTSEDTANVTIATDNNGLPFNLRCCKIIVVVPASTTGTANFIFASIRVTTQGNSSYQTLPTHKMRSADGTTYLAEVQTYPGGMAFIRACDASELGVSTGFFDSYAALKLFDEITAFKLEQYNSTSTLIPAGTRIVIIGIRN